MCNIISRVKNAELKYYINQAYSYKLYLYKPWAFRTQHVDFLLLML